jgi:xyloglucan-specific endo-beta-1,4-glucanase
MSRRPLTRLRRFPFRSLLSDRRSNEQQWDTQTIANGQYIVYNNLWGQAQASAGGSQCTTVGTVKGNDVAWSTQFNWLGEQGQVKSCTYFSRLGSLPTSVRLTQLEPRPSPLCSDSNVAVLKNLDVPLSSVKSIPSSWNWKWTNPSGGLVADVSYDLWLAPEKDATNTIELMIWLSAKCAPFLLLLPSSSSLQKEIADVLLARLRVL